MSSKSNRITLRSGPPLRAAIDPYIWGLKISDGRPVYIEDFDRIAAGIRDWEELRTKGIAPKRSPARTITNAELFAHFTHGKAAYCNHLFTCKCPVATYYFTGRYSGVDFAGNADPDALSLAMVDVDCHGIGTSETAKHFGRWLCGHYPKLWRAFWEASPNGLHGYIRLAISGLVGNTVRTLHETLDSTMRRAFEIYDSEFTGQISGAEAKGKPARRHYDGGQIMGFADATLATFPRNAEFFDSIPLIQVKDDEPYPETHRFEDSLILSPDEVDELATVIHALTPKAPSVPVVRLPTILPLPRATAAPKPSRGSVTRSIVRDGIQASDYLAVARSIAPEPIRVEGKHARAVVATMDVAIFLMMFDSFIAKANADGSVPSERFHENWKILKDEGRIDRGYNHSRFATIRNHLVDNGYIILTDPTFCQNKAMAWKPTAKLASLLIEISHQSGERRTDHLAPFLIGIHGSQQPDTAGARPIFSVHRSRGTG